LTLATISPLPAPEDPRVPAAATAVTPPPLDLDQRIDAMRRFNRFYTRRIGVLHDGYLHSPFSLAEVRVLYELAHRACATATELGRDLDLDAGYLSRILSSFERRGLLDKRKSDRDAREVRLSLSPAGHAAFAPLEASARDEIGALIARVPDSRQHELVAALSTIETLLGDQQQQQLQLEKPRPPTVTLRQHRPGDMGWVVERHGELYAREYGFDGQFEALVASIVARFLEHLDPQRERCWLAEADGARVGCVFLVKATRATAKLRLFLVEPDARGLGIGSRLVEDCLAFARAAGYRKVRLWTQSNLLAARHIHARAGFRKIEDEPHHSYSQDLVAETWELRL
jgi:DNA-binding MarR family transcriptional regulator/N-acetylglutamate synthase-like GNAT family acetyltransferase